MAMGIRSGRGLSEDHIGMRVVVSSRL